MVVPMRKTLFLLPLLGFATPALAQPAPQLPPELTDPATADRLADAMQGLSQALLDLRVGEVRAALEGRHASAAEKRMTVRDMARRDDPNFDRHVQQDIANVRPMVRQSMNAVNQALPAMMQGLAQAQQALERAVANMPDPTYPRR
jgi:ABC-type transporter Mla subunit MlaD